LREVAVASAAHAGRLLGRDAELAQLHLFLDAAPASARTLVLAGGPGFGKTALWEAGVESARRRGTTVLVARPSEPETQLSFAALGDLLETVDDSVLAALPDPQRRALEVALLRAEPSDQPPETRAIAAGCLGALRELASRAPLMVAIDDVQWLDAASAAALQFAQRRLDDESVAFLLTERTGSGTGRLGAERTERIEVGGLSIGAARLLLAERLDFHPSRMLLRRIFEATGGNPLFTLELGRSLRENDGHADTEQPLAVPSEVGVLLGRRLARLSAEAKTAALCAALASDPSTELIAALLGEAATASLAELVDAGVVEFNAKRIHFTHPLLASTVTSTALSRERIAMHRQLSQLVDDPVASASHLARAIVDRDEEVAGILEAAALLARARGGWDTAAELLERARDLTPAEDAEARRRRGIAAAEHHAHSGDRSRARALVEEILREPLSRAHRANALRLLGEITAENENFAGAITLLNETIQYVDDPILEASIEAGLAYLCSSNWDLTADVHAHRALEIAETWSDNNLMSRSLAACAMVDFVYGNGVDWAMVERALALEDHEAVMPLPARPSTVAALLDCFTGNHAEAREGLTAVWARAADQGDEGDLAFVLNWLSWLETRSGNFATAASVAEQAETLAILTGGASMRALAIAQRAFVDAHQGNATRARKAAAEAVAAGERVDFFPPRVWMSATLGLLELSVGNAEAAWQACKEMTVPIEEHGITEPITLFFLPDAIEALIALDELDRAELLVSALERRGRELDRPWALALGARGRGLILAAKGDLAGSVTALAGALIEHERLDMPFERARTLFVQGLVERRAKQRTNARASFTEARDAFERMGARLWAERAREELARVSGRRPRSSGELTPTEQRVVELATDGLTNKEIADALFVSVHTVETHLSHVYTKLGVRSRSQLPRGPDSSG
jgi:DNA-binding CsgD family transcriptional regulator